MAVVSAWAGTALPLKFRKCPHSFKCSQCGESLELFDINLCQTNQMGHEGYLCSLNVVLDTTARFCVHIKSKGWFRFAVGLMFRVGGLSVCSLHGFLPFPLMVYSLIRLSQLTQNSSIYWLWGKCTYSSVMVCSISELKWPDYLAHNEWKIRTPNDEMSLLKVRLLAYFCAVYICIF